MIDPLVEKLMPDIEKRLVEKAVEKLLPEFEVRLMFRFDQVYPQMQIEFAKEMARNVAHHVSVEVIREMEENKHGRVSKARTEG